MGKVLSFEKYKSKRYFWVREFGLVFFKDKKKK